MFGLHPADQYQLVSSPVEVNVAVPGVPPAVQIVAEDVNRVELTLTYIPGGGSGRVAPSPNPPGGSGIILGAGVGPTITFSYSDHPRLCQSAWWAIPSAGGGSIYAIAVSMPLRPEQFGYRNVFKLYSGIPLGRIAVAGNGRAVASRAGTLPKGILSILREHLPGLFASED